MEISKKRWNRLIGHLEELEAATGGRLRETPRESDNNCPIKNFAPDKVGSYDCGRAYPSGIEYVSPSGKYKHYGIYTLEDSEWWSLLPLNERRGITEQVSTWIKERREIWDQKSGLSTEK